MSSDPVPVVSPPEVPAAQTLVCANCGALLVGEYCVACGQRHEPHVHAIGHFAGEAFESITHADSRLWRTLGYLLVKPGRLTHEFFAGRRARYLPPFRLYLVISLLFFLVAGLPGHVRVDDDGPPTAESVAKLNAAADSLEANAVNTPGLNLAAAALRKKAAHQQAVLDGKKLEEGGEAEPQDSDRVESDLCTGVTQPTPDAGWAEQARYGFCQKISHMSGKALIEAVVHNIPRAMFVLLPLLALAMKLLYWRPKRYYVEHLLFLVHNHCFVFLAITLMILAADLTLISGLIGWLETAIGIYIVWYIFGAMRVFYGQSRWMTVGKFMIMFCTYFLTSGVVLAGVAIYSALTL